MRIRRTLGTIAASAAMAAALVAGAPPAAAAVTCEYTDAVGFLFVGMTGDGVATLSRDGETILVNGLTCSDGGTDATVTNVEIVSFGGDAGNQRVRIDLSGGRFAPGRFDEPGESDEIEMFTELTGGTDRVDVLGRDGRDAIVLGTDGLTTRINLNAREGDTVDYDLSLDPDDVERLVIRGRGGADLLSAAGSDDTGDVLARPVTLYGGDGRDVLSGGAANDVLNDRGDPGDVDLLQGRGGADRLLSRDGDRRDRSYGGPGIDVCVADPGELTRSC
jgi:hypothetical protein